MRVRGKSNIEAEDILFYNCVASVARDVSKRIADELTPTFIVDEAMSYFSDKEDYEVCQTIKKFYDVRRVDHVGNERLLPIDR